jgi:hypothetical protein
MISSHFEFDKKITAEIVKDPNFFRFKIICSDGVYETDSLILLTRSQLVRYNRINGINMDIINLEFTGLTMGQFAMWLLTLINPECIDANNINYITVKHIIYLTGYFQIDNKYEELVSPIILKIKCIKGLYHQSSIHFPNDIIYLLIHAFTGKNGSSNFDSFALINWDDFNSLVKDLTIDIVKLIECKRYTKFIVYGQLGLNDFEIYTAEKFITRILKHKYTNEKNKYINKGNKDTMRIFFDDIEISPNIYISRYVFNFMDNIYKIIVNFTYLKRNFTVESTNEYLNLEYIKIIIDTLQDKTREYYDIIKIGNEYTLKGEVDSTTNYYVEHKMWGPRIS